MDFKNYVYSFLFREKTLPRRAAGSDGDVPVFHSIAPAVSLAFPARAGSRSEAQIRHDIATPALPHLCRKTLKVLDVLWEKVTWLPFTPEPYLSNQCVCVDENHSIIKPKEHRHVFENSTKAIISISYGFFQAFMTSKVELSVGNTKVQMTGVASVSRAMDALSRA